MITYIVLFFALLSRLTELACGSTWVTSFLEHVFWISIEVVYLQHWHGWTVQVLCTPYNHAPCHFMQCHIHKICVFSCNLPPALLAEWPGYFKCYCSNMGWNGYRNKSQHRESRPWRRKFSRCSCRDSNQWPFSHKSGALTTELSPIQFHSTDSILPIHKHCKSVTSLPVIQVLVHKGLCYCKNCQHLWQCILLFISSSNLFYWQSMFFKLTW